MSRTRYIMEGRNGYGAIDRYKDDICIGHVLSCDTLKDTTLMNQALNEAVSRGHEDLLGDAAWHSEQREMLLTALDAGIRALNDLGDWDEEPRQYYHPASQLQELHRRIREVCE